MQSPISINPQVMHGTPVFEGTRVPIQHLFDYLQGGDDLAEFLDDFPSVSAQMAQQVLQLAASKLLERAA